MPLPRTANHDDIDIISEKAKALGPNEQVDRTFPSEGERPADAIKVKPLPTPPAKKEQVRVLIPVLAMKGLQSLSEKLQKFMDQGELDEATLDRIVKEVRIILRRIERR